jgi:biotin synthase
VTAIRHDWTRDEIRALFDLPFSDLLYRAQCAHRAHFDPNAVQVSTLLSIKTGACPEDCGYCPQSAHHAADLEREALLDVDAVVSAARAARDAGASREVKALGLETCVTLGMLKGDQAARLRDAGLDYYNHNLDTSPEYYGQIITTRTFDERLDTLAQVREAGVNVCCGGIVGMGESRDDRVGLLESLANLPEHPQSVPINYLVQVAGTPLAGTAALDPLEFVRTIAVARLLMPASVVRLSAGRESMDDALQALCFLAGANSIFYGDRLLTTGNPAAERDRALFERLGIQAAAPVARCAAPPAQAAAGG